MYTIGAFSAISGISKKTLRYYDEINLLKPAKINEDNGYRLYEKEQLRNSRDILYYKSMGLSLEEINVLIYSKTRNSKVDYLNNRLIQIDDEIKKLQQQRTKLEEALKDKMTDQIDFCSFTIEKGIQKAGIVLSVKGDAEDYQNLIGALYEKAAKEGLAVLKVHKIKRWITEDNNQDIEVYGYIDKQHPLSKEIKESETFDIKAVSLRLRNQAIARLFDYVNSIGKKIVYIIETYSIHEGQMTLDISAVL